jgi:hypothetical protein
VKIFVVVLMRKLMEILVSDRFGFEIHDKNELVAPYIYEYTPPLFVFVFVISLFGVYFSRRLLNEINEVNIFVVGV